MKLSKEWLDFLRTQLANNVRIRTRDMDQDIPKPGAMAVLRHIDDNGILHVDWEHGADFPETIEQHLAAIVPPDSISFKLYMPLTADLLREGQECGPSAKLSGKELLPYASDINSELIRCSDMPDDELSLGELGSKAKFTGYSAEEHCGELWGVAQFMVMGELSAEELRDLKSYVEGDAARGLGSVFEGHEMDVYEGSLSVYLWNDSFWNLQTEAELMERKNCMKMEKGWLDFLREQYPNGSRIKLRKMGQDDPDPVKPGAMGTLYHIDDQGGFHIKWDNGRDLSLVIGQDSFTVLPPPIQTLKLYMPLTVGYFDDDGYGGSEEEYTMSPGEAAEYAPQIIAALEKERRWLIDYGESHNSEEAERGLMAYYDEPDGVDQKVQSYWFTAEVRDGQLWGVAECKVRGELTPEELEKLKDDITGQAADGFGESVEQREIRVNGGQEIYAHLWQSGKDWSIQTEQERFGPKLAEGLPEMCFSTLKSTGELICIKRGESGYYRSDWNTSDRARNEEIAKDSNESLGVTEAQRKAMEAGSMFGWSCAGADPKTYEQTANQRSELPTEARHDGFDGAAMGGMGFA